MEGYYEGEISQRKTNTTKYYSYEECKLIKLIDAEDGMVVARACGEREREKY